MGENDDRDLFRKTFADVKPLEQDRVAPTRPIQPPRRREERSQNHFHRADYSAHPDSFHRGGLQRATLRNFRRGGIRPECRLDLHGYPRDRAQRTLEAFLYRAGTRGHRCVLIIHGKGQRSEARVAVLRQMVRAVLFADPEVIAYFPAQPRDGGEGAVYAYLKRR